MYTTETIIKLIKKTRELRNKWLSIRRIADKLKVNKNTINKRIKIDFNKEITRWTIEKRWFKKWEFRKHNKEEIKRIIKIFNDMIEEKKFFINERTIKENYVNIYKEELKINYIKYIMQKEWLRRRKKKHIKKWSSKYMSYPENTINKLGKIIMWIDFIWPRYIEKNNKPYYFLSSRYIRPKKHWKIELIEWETTENTINKLLLTWEKEDIPDVLRIDNDSAFWMLKSSKTKRNIGTFTKFLLYLWIKPLYSTPRQPWNNWNVEWQNSVFNKLFWKEIFFDNENSLNIELKRFNAEYERYSNLLEEKDIKINWKTIKNIEKEKWIDILDKWYSYFKWIKKDDFKEKKIYILRKVSRIWDKWWIKEKWQIDIIWELIEIDKIYINQILLNELDVDKWILKIWIEKDWKLQIIKEKKYVIKNIQ